MYRLICPVVDAALEVNGLEAFFEYSQPNGPNRRLSADVAILRNEEPVWLIEAKRFTQKLHPDLVAGYLKPGVMGVVTNGNDWIFVVRGKHLRIGPMVHEDGTIDIAIRDALVRTLSSVSEDDALRNHTLWCDAWVVPKKSGKAPAVWEVNRGKGSRVYAEKETFTRLRDAVQKAAEFAKPDSQTGFFLEEVLQSGSEIPGGSIEVSEKRLIWWLPGGGRGVRINLESKQLEILVHNSLLDAVGRHNIKASIKLHDKNHAMSVCKASTPAELRSLVPVFTAVPKVA
ncbi:hypothetical protein [Ramlibacter alkalitolerans]|uniref:Type I restriction enzyme R protein N-terminal domain-containing protein n=1 Tax=Ramlibacter alkalitolerans TaxID=2039631 RepID=A0ABS1JWR0_9BURK|nr:hypothetical protein [Ramlibacter alkalitolerans]MBL0428753.1 hypothetical protein [Ramlibacter alkalitolerans]